AGTVGRLGLGPALGGICSGARSCPGDGVGRALHLRYGLSPAAALQPDAAAAPCLGCPLVRAACARRRPAGPAPTSLRRAGGEESSAAAPCTGTGWCPYLRRAHGAAAPPSAAGGGGVRSLYGRSPVLARGPSGARGVLALGYLSLRLSGGCDR